MVPDKQKMVLGCGMYSVAILIAYLATKKFDDFSIQLACMTLVGISGPSLLLEYKLDGKLYLFYPSCDRNYFFTVGFYTLMISIFCSIFVLFVPGYLNIG